ncbi:MAG: hypothetical protein R2911_16895 [Caldilineaceae bacterium]
MTVSLSFDEIDEKNVCSYYTPTAGGYFQRPQEFPAALALIGLRYPRHKVVGSDRLISPAHLTWPCSSITLRNFTANEGELSSSIQMKRSTLYAEATACFELTQEPWLVNALAKEASKIWSPIWRSGDGP